MRSIRWNYTVIYIDIYIKSIMCETDIYTVGSSHLFVQYQIKVCDNSLWKLALIINTKHINT